MIQMRNISSDIANNNSRPSKERIFTSLNVHFERIKNYIQSTRYYLKILFSDLLPFPNTNLGISMLCWSPLIVVDHTRQKLDQEQGEAAYQCTWEASSNSPLRLQTSQQSQLCWCRSKGHMNWLFWGCPGRRGTIGSVLAYTWIIIGYCVWLKISVSLL